MWSMVRFTPLASSCTAESDQKVTYSLCPISCIDTCLHYCNDCCATYSTVHNSTINYIKTACCCDQSYQLHLYHSVPCPRRNYSDAMWNTYITEAIQSGICKKYCTDPNIPYSTFNRNMLNITNQMTKRIGHPNLNVDTVILCSLTVLRNKQLNNSRLNMMMLAQLNRWYVNNIK